MGQALRILLATDSMKVGGAETHIYELARQLKSRGHFVMLFSEGGALADRLEREGILQVQAPLRTKNPLVLRKSYGVLLRAIEHNRIGVLHAHARTPAFLCHLAAQKKQLPLVVSDHAKFVNSNPFMKAMTRWGDKTLAVSEDLKRYLIDTYPRVTEKSVSVTVNGINADTFRDRSDDTDHTAALYRELGIPDGRRMILSVSRLDRTAYLCVYELLDIAPKLCERFPDTVVVIVGGGELLEEVRRKVSEVNAVCGREYVVLTGPRSDVHRFCGACAAFVGCARSALEAAACEKPVVIAGNGGLLGLLTLEQYDFCTKSNFTARGIDTFPLDDFLNAICAALSLKEKGAGATLRQIRENIVRDYSVQRMTEDAERAYQAASRVPKGRYDCTITGYYGHGNTGDDSLLTAAVANLRARKPTLRICVLCRKNRELAARLCAQDIAVKSRFGPFAVLTALSRSDALIFGGGTLLQDNTSTKSLLYYIALIRLAHRIGIKIMLYGNGVGPIRREKNKTRVKRALALCDVLAMRDEASYRYVLDLSLPHPVVALTADEALTLPLPQKRTCQAVLASLSLHGAAYAVVSVRRWRRAEEKLYDDLGKSLQSFFRETGLVPVFAVMEREHDLAVTERLAGMIPNSRIADLGADPERIAALAECASFVISMRLHALIFAALACVPACGIAYDPKVESFLGSMGQEQAVLHASDFDGDECLTRLLALYHARDEKGEEERRRERLQDAKSRAQRNCELAVEMLEQAGIDRKARRENRGMDHAV